MPTLIDLTNTRQSYKKHYALKTYLNHDSRIKLQAYNPYNDTISSKSLIEALEQATTDSPEFFIGWRTLVYILVFVHRPMMQHPTLGET